MVPLWEAQQTVTGLSFASVCVCVGVCLNIVFVSQTPSREEYSLRGDTHSIGFSVKQGGIWTLHHCALVCNGQVPSCKHDV